MHSQTVRRTQQMFEQVAAHPLGAQRALGLFPQCSVPCSQSRVPAALSRSHAAAAPQLGMHRMHQALRALMLLPLMRLLAAAVKLPARLH